MRTIIYVDENMTATRVVGHNPHTESVEFRLDGTEVTIATFRYGRCGYIIPTWENRFSDMVKLYHQYQGPGEPDDEFYRMVVDNEDGTHRYWIRYKEDVTSPTGSKTLKYYDDNVAGDDELLLIAEEGQYLRYAKPVTPLWLIQLLVALSRYWFAE